MGQVGVTVSIVVRRPRKVAMLGRDHVLHDSSGASDAVREYCGNILVG